MDRREWTQAQIGDFVLGRVLHLRDSRARSVDPPPWLAGAETSPVDAGQRLMAMHDDDRARYLHTYNQALAEPGTPHGTTYRIRAGERWAVERASFLNLLGHPHLDAVAIAVERLELIDCEDGTRPNRGVPKPAAWLLAHLDEDSRITAVEGRVEEMTGRTSDELVGMVAADLIHADSHSELVASFVQLQVSRDGTAHSHRCFVHPDGTELWAECTMVRRDGDPSSTRYDGALLMAVDITERMAQEEALRASHQEFRLLAEDLPVAVFRADPEGRIVYRNQRWAELYPGAEQAERVPDAFDPAAWDELWPGLHDRLVSGADRLDFEVLAADGRTVLAVSGRPVEMGRAGSTGFVGSVADVTAAVALRRRANHDQLTGLLNRHALHEELAAAMRAEPGATLLLFVDLDGFKAVNDSHGHATGDLVLREVARRLRRAVRPTDILGRYGGDEFVLVCGGLSPGDSDRVEQVVRRRLDEAFAEPIVWPGGQWQPAASVGAALPGTDEHPDQALERADLAMFARKRRRRDGGTRPPSLVAGQVPS